MSAPSGPERRVLLVEDDVSNALTLAALLEDLGCSVDTATSLAAARQQLLQARYAVVILDQQLGDGKGQALLPLLVRSATPAVLLSGLAESVDQPRDFAAVHAKGADPEEVMNTVRRLIAE